MIRDRQPHDVAAPGPLGIEPAAAGHFTTMQLRGGRAQGLDLHLARLREASLEMYGAAPDAASLRSRVRDALIAAGMGEGDCTLRIRIHADRPCGSGHGRDSSCGTPIAAVAAPTGMEAGESELRAGPAAGHIPLHLAVDIEPPRHPSPHPLRVRTHHGQRACPGVKHLALRYQIDARDAARAAGFDDALFVTSEGCIAEGTFWNIAFWDGRAVVWPEGPALRGVTARLLQAGLGGPGGLPSRWGSVAREAIGDFTAAFALNSTGIQDIASVDGHRFPGDVRVGTELRALLGASPREPF